MLSSSCRRWLPHVRHSSLGSHGTHICAAGSFRGSFLFHLIEISYQTKNLPSSPKADFVHATLALFWKNKHPCAEKTLHHRSFPAVLSQDPWIKILLFPDKMYKSQFGIHKQHLRTGSLLFVSSQIRLSVHFSTKRSPAPFLLFMQLSITQFSGRCNCQSPFCPGSVNRTPAFRRSVIRSPTDRSGTSCSSQTLFSQAWHRFSAPYSTIM